MASPGIEPGALLGRGGTVAVQTFLTVPAGVNLDPLFYFFLKN